MSARWTITDEIGRIRLGSLELPGVYTSLEIAQAVKLDKQDVPGQSGARKQVTGYEDATVSITLLLYSDDEETCFDKLRKIQSVFRRTDRSAKPEVMRLLNEHTEARGIDKVLFVDFRSSDTNENDLIEATLELEEYIPVIPVTKESRAERPAAKTPEKNVAEVPNGQEEQKTDEKQGEEKNTVSQEELAAYKHDPDSLASQDWNVFAGTPNHEPAPAPSPAPPPPTKPPSPAQDNDPPPSVPNFDAFGSGT